MAMLRITSSKVVPYAVRAISSGRALSGFITNAFNGCDQVPSAISHHFSTDAKKQSDRKLVKFLKSEIKSKKMFLEREMPAIPTDFPFTIKDDPNDGGDINLTRDFHGEKIDVVVDMPCDMDVDDVDSDDDSNSDGDTSNDDVISGSDDDDVSSSDSENDESEPFELKVTISKENGKILEFEVSAFADEITVNSVLLKEPAAESSDPLLSFGPYHVEEEGDLQIALREFLKTRGIKESNCGFLYKYMLEKCRKQPVVALKMLRNFIAE